MERGCKQVPPEIIGGKTLWAHPDGYFISGYGRMLKPCFSPSSRKATKGSCYPSLYRFGNRLCHSVMAITFYGPRPTFENTSVPLQGKGQERGSYVGICHHLIPDKLDYRPANLLCWLTRAEHTEADRRQRMLRKILPDMHILSYSIHRQMQDPRVTTREKFDEECKWFEKVFCNLQF